MYMHSGHWWFLLTRSIHPLLQVVSFPGDAEIVQLVIHPSGRHCLALSVSGEVFSWGEGENGQLGLGDAVK